MKDRFTWFDMKKLHTLSMVGSNTLRVRDDRRSIHIRSSWPRISICQASYIIFAPTKVSFDDLAIWLEKKQMWPRKMCHKKVPLRSLQIVTALTGSNFSAIVKVDILSHTHKNLFLTRAASSNPSIVDTAHKWSYFTRKVRQNYYLRVSRVKCFYLGLK